MNHDVDTIDIGESLFRYYKPIAHTFRRLKFEREESYEGYYQWESRELANFSKVTEMHVVCADGLYGWLNALEEHYWPCGVDNVFLIDPDDETRVFRGMQGVLALTDMMEREMQERELLEQSTHEQ